MRLLSVFLMVCALVAGAAAQDEASLFYSRSFPGSVPPYMEVKVSAAGDVEYREAPGEDNPVTFKLTAEQTASVFDLAARLGHFGRKIESGLPVARMGEKTFRWTRGAETREQKFNYTTDPDAQALQDWFERMTESAIRFYDLERVARFDKLGVNKALLLLETYFDRGRLVGLEQFLPLLDKIAKNTTYMNMARDRAAKLAAVFRDPPPPPVQQQSTKKGK